MLDLDIFRACSLLMALLMLSRVVSIFKARRYLLVKPSIWFLIFFHFQIQWASTIYAVEVFERLEFPWIFFVLTQVLPLVLFYFSSRTYVKQSKSMYQSVLDFGNVYSEAYLSKVLSVTFVISALIVIYYFLNVPFKKTGLYEIFTGSDVLLATQARENSLKLTSAGVRYSYLFFNKFLAVLIIVILSIRAYQYYDNRRYFYVFISIGIALLIATLASLSGARSHGLYTLLGGAVAVFFIRGLRVKVVRYTLVFVLLLSVPVILQILKFNVDFTMDNVLKGYEVVLVSRALKVPMETGLNWVAYVELNGVWGFQGVSFLSSFSNESPVNVANFMMSYYNDDLSVSSGLMNTSFVFSYYSYFGIFITFMFPIFMSILDMPLTIYNQFSGPLKVIATVTTCLSTINLISTEFHTLFISYGFMTGLLFYLFLYYVWVPKHHLKR